MRSVYLNVQDKVNETHNEKKEKNCSNYPAHLHLQCTRNLQVPLGTVVFLETCHLLVLHQTDGTSMLGLRHYIKE